MDYRCMDTDTLSLSELSVDGPVMVLPFTETDQAQRAGQLAAHRAGTQGLVLAVHDTLRQGFVATVNQAFAHTRSPWFGYMAQDAFAGRNWMAQALQTLHRQNAVLLGFNDGKWQGALASFGLASREWAVQNYPSGDFFFPAYNSHFADAELTLLALSAKRYAYNSESLLIEVDWDKDRASVHSADRALYRQRAITGFDHQVADPMLLQQFA